MHLRELTDFRLYESLFGLERQAAREETRTTTIDEDACYEDYSMPAEKLVGDRSRHAVNRIDTLRSWVVEQGQS